MKNAEVAEIASVTELEGVVPVVYVREIVEDAGVNGVVPPIWIVTAKNLSGAGAFARRTMKVVEPTLNPPHPAAATTVRVIGVAVAVPPVNVTESQDGSG